MEQLIGSALLQCLVKEEKVERRAIEAKSYRVIVFCFENGWLQCEPIPSSDEIHLSLISPKPIDMELEEYQIHHFGHISGRLQVVWKCKNTNDYDDMIVLGFRHLDPSIAIVCEGGVLNVFLVSGPVS